MTYGSCIYIQRIEVRARLNWAQELICNFPVFYLVADTVEKPWDYTLLALRRVALYFLCLMIKKWHSLVKWLNRFSSIPSFSSQRKQISSSIETCDKYMNRSDEYRYICICNTPAFYLPALSSLESAFTNFNVFTAKGMYSSDLILLFYQRRMVCSVKLFHFKLNRNRFHFTLCLHNLSLQFSINAWFFRFLPMDPVQPKPEFTGQDRCKIESSRSPIRILGFKLESMELPIFSALII